MKFAKFIIAATLLTTTITAAAYVPTKETLKYDIIYHWGVIWKHAATATLSIQQTGANCNATLAARTDSWADKIFEVRDTLSCSFRRSGLQPIVYRKASHEGGKYSLDIVKYSHSNGTVTGNCTRVRPDKPNQTTTLQSKGPTYDMLSIFYYLRNLNYEAMNKNTRYSATIFSGKKKEKLTIQCHGIESIELQDDTQRNAWHISFSFTQDGQTKSSDDMDTWLSTDASHKPLMLKGKLPIGEVRCYLKE